MKNKEATISNYVFLSAFLIPIATMIFAGIASYLFPSFSLIVNDTIALILILIVPIPLLINALYSVRLNCAGWWAFLKGVISFVFIHLLLSSMGYIFEYMFKENSLYFYMIVAIFQAIIWSVLILPIVGLIRKKNHKANL